MKEFCQGDTKYLTYTFKFINRRIVVFAVPGTDSRLGYVREFGKSVDRHIVIILSQFVDPGKNIEAGVSRIIHELCSFYNSDANNLRNVYYRNYNSKERYGIFVK